MEQFNGLGVAIVTPFTADGEVDYEALRRLIAHLIAGGADYLVVQGTTGESVTMSKEEKVQMLEVVVDINENRLPIVLGIGGNNTAQVINDYDCFDLSRVAAILSASPAYNKPTQDGIYQHYKEIIKNTDKPIILYNVPGRTASNVTSETTLKLAHEFEEVVGIKEASNNLSQIMEIIQNKPDDFTLISGDDGLTLPIIALGGAGVISVVANAYPKQFSTMVNLALANDYVGARKEHYKLTRFIDMLFAEGNPGGIKAALKILGISGDTMRLPLVNISSPLYELMEKEMSEIN